jgi:chorismate mutase
MTRAVRGAIQVQANTRTAIEEATVRLVGEVLRVNAIAENQLVSILFSLTDDLSAANPATALRRIGFVATPLFCVQEAKIDGAMSKVVRVMVTWDSPERRTAVPVYLDGAETLRRDLAPGEQG